MKYCSSECFRRKFEINQDYFKSLDSPEKFITLGQIVAIGHIKENLILKLVSNQKTLEDITNKLESTYPIRKSERGLFKIEIACPELVKDLLELGLSNNYLYQDLPDMRSLEGLLNTHCYTTQSDQRIFRTLRSKLAKVVEDEFSGKIITNTFKWASKGVTGLEYIVYF